MTPSSEPIDLTIAIPTFNRADYLPDLLERLRSQRHTDSLRWEIIVVDNNSRDCTAEVVATYQQQWQHPAPLHYCHEPRQGSALARQQAVGRAQGEWIGFIDDDILPDLDWVANAMQFCRQHPQLGAVSGSIGVHYDGELPPYFEAIASFLSIREYGDVPRWFNAKTLDLPTTAALVVRRQAWLDAVPDTLLLPGRLDSSLVGGEDYELLSYLQQAGWAIGFNPAMPAVHRLSSDRLQPDYLLNLAYSSGLMVCYLNWLNSSHWERSLIPLKTRSIALRRLIRYGLTGFLKSHSDKRSKSHQDSFVDAFYRQFHHGMWHSPGYFKTVMRSRSSLNV